MAGLAGPVEWSAAREVAANIMLAANKMQQAVRILPGRTLAGTVEAPGLSCIGVVIVS